MASGGGGKVFDSKMTTPAATALWRSGSGRAVEDLEKKLRATLRKAPHGHQRRANRSVTGAAQGLRRASGVVAAPSPQDCTKPTQSTPTTWISHPARIPGSRYGGTLRRQSGGRLHLECDLLRHLERVGLQPCVLEQRSPWHCGSCTFGGGLASI